MLLWVDWGQISEPRRTKAKATKNRYVFDLGSTLMPCLPHSFSALHHSKQQLLGIAAAFSKWCLRGGLLPAQIGIAMVSKEQGPKLLDMHSKMPWQWLYIMLTCCPRKSTRPDMSGPKTSCRKVYKKKHPGILFVYWRVTLFSTNFFVELHSWCVGSRVHSTVGGR